MIRMKYLILVGEYLDKKILKRKVGTYSLGQKKLLSLIILKILKPKLIILDEFKNGLDFENFVKLKKFLIEIKKDSLILLSGHDIQYIEFSDEIFKLDNMKLEKIDKQKLYEEIEKIG